MDTNTLKTTALQKARNATTAMDLIIIQHYADILNSEKTVLSGPLADPTAGNLAKEDVVVVPPANTCSPTMEAQVLPTHIDHLISQEDIEALLDLNKLVTSHLVQTLAQKVNYIWVLHQMDKLHFIQHFKW